MTDRELLELAARAAGIELWHEEVFTNGLTQKVSDNGILRWNPLTDDGDALRLAVKLGLCLDLRAADRGEVWVGQYPVEQGDNGVVDSDVRRAIVLVAAEIGRNMV